MTRSAHVTWPMTHPDRRRASQPENLVQKRWIVVSLSIVYLG